MTAFGALVGGGDLPALATVALLAAAVLLVGALLPGWVPAMRPPMQAVLVLAGLLLGHGGLNVLSLDYRGDAVAGVAAAAMIVLLLRAGLEFDVPALRRLGRGLLAVAPLTAMLVAVASRALFGMAWTEAFLLGAVLAPIGPRAAVDDEDGSVLSRSLRIESAAGVGFALPLVIALATAARPDIGFDWTRVLVGELGLGLLTGIVVGLAASIALPRAAPRAGARLFGALCGFAGIAAYAAAIPLSHANGFIAVYACAVTIVARQPDLRERLRSPGADGADLMIAVVLVVYGTLLTRHRMTHADWEGMALVVAVLVVIRPLAALATLRRGGPDNRVTALLAWYAPRGALAMALALAVVGAPIPASDNLFNLAGPVILASVVAHGFAAALLPAGRLGLTQGSRGGSRA